MRTKGRSIVYIQMHREEEIIAAFKGFKLEAGALARTNGRHIKQV